MSFMEEFEACLESLPPLLQRKYSVLHDLDKSLTESQRHNELRCEREIVEIERGIRSGNLMPDASVIRFSDEALDEQKHCIGIADEKVALAGKAYDMVDAYIQVLDQYLRRSEEARRQAENDISAAAGVSDPSSDANVKSEKGSVSGRGGRNKKMRLATVPSDAPLMDLELPVDPNEPTYCFCNQVSYGEMVACDHPSCKIEWFHFGCVGLREQPKGKWFCADCAGLKSRRKGK